MGESALAIATITGETTGTTGPTTVEVTGDQTPATGRRTAGCSHIDALPHHLQEVDGTTGGHVTVADLYIG